MGGVFVAVFVWVAWPGEREPQYNGRRLSEWLRNQPPAPVSPLDPNPQWTAVNAIGTNALPWLLKWVQYKPKAWRKLLRSVGEMTGWPRVQRDHNRELVYDAWLGFQFLGPKARAAVPELSRMLNNPRDPGSAFEAAGALGEVGVEALPVLITALTNGECPVPSRVAVCIAYLHGVNTNATLAAPALLQCLKSRDPGLAAAAALALSFLDMEPEVIIPALSEQSLKNPSSSVLSDAATALWHSGYPAVPALRQVLGDPDPKVSAAAAKALMRIDPALLTNGVAK